MDTTTTTTTTTPATGTSISPIPSDAKSIAIGGVGVVAGAALGYGLLHYFAPKAKTWVKVLTMGALAAAGGYYGYTGTV